MQQDIPFVAFAAYSGTGKTTLIEKLVRHFQQTGLRPAVVKHDGHGFEIDHVGKDTWRFAKAGAAVTVISSAAQSAYIERRPLSLAQVLAMLHDVDIILIEGYKNEDLPQIGIARQATGKGFPAEPSRFLAVVSDFKVSCDVPQFGLEDIDEIAAFIRREIIGKKPGDFTHFNEDGRAKMVDVGEKAPSGRTAVAAARVLVNPQTFAKIQSGGMKKGDVLAVAQVAGVMGAKRTPELIPMCHPVLLDGIDLSLHLDAQRCSVEIEASVCCDGRTGVEMEALTAVSTAALTVYDMCKAVQKDIVITDIRLLRKTGGVHGDFERAR